MNRMCPQAQAGTETHPNPEAFAKEFPRVISVSILSVLHSPLKRQKGKPAVSVKQQRLMNQGPLVGRHAEGTLHGTEATPQHECSDSVVHLVTFIV